MRRSLFPRFALQSLASSARSIKRRLLSNYAVKNNEAACKKLIQSKFILTATINSGSSTKQTSLHNGFCVSFRRINRQIKRRRCNVKSERESVWKGLNSTFGAKFAVFLLISSVLRSARALSSVVGKKKLGQVNFRKDVWTFTNEKKKIDQ